MICNLCGKDFYTTSCDHFIVPINVGGEMSPQLRAVIEGSRTLEQRVADLERRVHNLEARNS